MYPIKKAAIGQLYKHLERINHFDIMSFTLCADFLCNHFSIFKNNHSWNTHDIISDCRFGNECTDFTALLMRHDAPANLHETERFTATLMNDVFFGNPDGYFHDYTLWNTGTIEELERNIRFMLTTIDFSDYQ